ncbi:MAG: hypothetical protein ACRDRT_14685 [Pseudonocardiaceae bacterium]
MLTAGTHLRGPDRPAVGNGHDLHVAAARRLNITLYVPAFALVEVRAIRPDRQRCWPTCRRTQCGHVPTRLSPDPPVSVALRLTGPIEAHTQPITGRPRTRTPAHLRIQIDQLVWQVCDQQAWRRIGDAWFQAQQYLDSRVRPSASSLPGSYSERRPA